MQGAPNRKHNAWLGAGAAGIAGTGLLLYRAAPTFWNQYTKEMKRPVEPAPNTPTPKKWPNTGLHAAWIGHSTVLLKIDGFTILTDPVFSLRAGLNVGVATLGVKRLVTPALDLPDLPKIDLILLSHAHMDHFDLPSLRRLQGRQTSVITAMRTADLLKHRKYAQVTEIGWGGECQVGPVTVRGIEVNHWGARVRTDTYRGYNGYVIRAGRSTVLFAGDTANTTKFRNVAGGNVDLALMPIGAYNPWIRYHCNPEEAWRMTEDARAEHVLPIHHSTFQLGREPRCEPMERLKTAAGNAEKRIVIHRVGEQFSLN